MRPAVLVMLGFVASGFIAAGGFACAPAEPARTPDAAPLAIPPLPNASGPATPTSVPTARRSARCITPMAEAPPPIPPPAAGSSCPRDPDGSPTLGTSEVTFPDTPGTPALRAEIASRPADIERGLMYRRSMTDSAGMLFKLDERRDHTFWMHNTCIALDMMFVEADGLIVGIVEGAEPLTDAIRHVGCASSYVLEVNGGWARKHDVKPGQRITIPSIAR